jgi:hypothetical protein
MRNCVIAVANYVIAQPLQLADFLIAAKIVIVSLMSWSI